MAEPTIIERIGKLLIQSERTNNEAEQDVFFKKAQELASRHSVELELARQAVTNKELLETPTHKRIQIAQDGTQLRPVFCELFMAIGGAQDLKFTIAHDSTYVNAYGFPSDIAITEAIYAHVVHQMMEECAAFIRGGTWRDEKVIRYNRRTGAYEQKTINARVVKRQFFEAFSSRIGRRLREAKREAEAQKVTVTSSEGVTSESTGALVLVRKKDAVNDYYETNNNARGTWGGNRNTYTSNAGLSGGAAAGDRARLGGQRSLPGSRTALG